MALTQQLLSSMTLLIIVQVCSACGGDLTAQAGTIISPNFPNGYPDVVNCIWTITVADTQIITLRFYNFEVDIYDSVLFYDGDSNQKPLINETLSGYWSDSKLSNFRIRTTGPQLYVVFTSYGAPSGPGFSATYWAHECAPMTYGIDYCDKPCTCQAENTQYCESSTGKCVCKNGWQSTNCDVDVNECDNANSCPDMYSHCVNTIGSFSCVCRAGLQQNASGSCLSTCTQANQCSHACGVISTTPYVEECYCPKGMQLNSTNNHTCYECRDWFYGEDCKFMSSCNIQNTKVLNKVNGLCTCYLNWTSTDCTYDVDECSFQPCNVNNSACWNYYGSYQCQCNFGYENYNETTCNECGRTLTNSSGIISSKYYYDYTNFYLNKIDVCSWIISVEKTHVIDIRFTNFNFYNGYRTFTGYVEIHDGPNLTAPLLGHFDGRNYHYGRLPPNYIRSSGNTMYIARTAESYYSNGFDMSYSSHECPAFFYDTSCSTPCNCFKDNTDYCNSTSGQCVCKPQWTSADCTVDKNECLVDPLACPNYSDCTNLQPGYQCDCKIGMEKNTAGQCVYSNATSTACTQRQCSHVCVKLKSNAKEKCYCPMGMALVDDTCTNCSSGTFGPDCSLNCQCVVNNTASCDPISGQCVCLPGWTSDDCSQDIDECYFDLYNCNIDYSSCRNTQGDYACDCQKYNGYENADTLTCKRIECRNILINASGIITSPEYPSKYFNNANCSWLITVNEGNIISVRFEDFNTGLYNYDHVMFYNGNDTNAKVIGRYSGSLETIPRIIRSNSNTMFIKFISDPYNYGGYETGFKAIYTSHPCPYYKFGETCSEYCHCNSENTQFCDNIKGDCVCKPGWKGTTCYDDVNECLGTNNVLCPSNSDCENTAGSYTCRCHLGYVQNVSTGLCDGKFSLHFFLVFNISLNFG